MDSTQILNLYLEANRISQDLNQAIGQKNDYYITLAQLEALIYKYDQH